MVFGSAVGQPSFFPLFCFDFPSVIMFPPSRRVIQVRMSTWSVETSECQAACELGGSRLRLRLRPPSPAQSSPSLLCLVPCLCLPSCCRSCVFPWFCNCFFSFLISCSRLCFPASSGLCPSPSVLFLSKWSSRSYTHFVPLKCK